MSQRQTETVTVYKVVRRDWDDKLRSALITSCTWAVCYEPHTPARAQLSDSSLFAFGTLELAKAFAETLAERLSLKGNVEIWEAVAEPGALRWRILPYWRINTFWKFWQVSGYIPEATQCPPAGTVFCKTITLQKKVATWEPKTEGE